jgi:dTMP kinase
MIRGLLIVVEGINGAGKTTIINQVVNKLEYVGHEVVVYKFPDRKGLYGSHIDRYLKGELTITSKYDILHMFAANRFHVCEDIENDIRNGKVVICDRYIFSAIAYHIPQQIDDPKKVHNYCNIIGYFDKDMPLPDMIYLIEGDHIHRRGILNREIFHHSGNKAWKLKNMIYNVIHNYTTCFTVLKNYDGRMMEVVNHIVNDIINAVD